MEKENTKNGTVAEVLSGTLCGAGQVMFQKSVWTSLLFLAGIFWGAWIEGRMAVAWGAVAGLVVSTGTGALLGLKPEEGRQGLWGFNGILVGCAFMTFLRPTPLCWLAMLLCAASTVWVREGLNRVMAPWRVNSFTMPFVLMTWFFLAAAHAMKGLPVEGLADPAFPASFSVSVAEGWLDLIVYALKGVAQVFLIDSWVTGLLFLVGLALSNGWSAFWAAVASALSLGTILLFQGAGASIAGGLYGFSPVLTGIALGSIFYKPSWRTALWTLLGIVLTVFVQAAMNVVLTPVGLPALTAPFCITTWLFLLPLLKLNDPADPDHSDWDEGRKPHLKRRSNR
ncbi:urea transporter [uncultured Alistipes sp.]|uniref:urea transporter n=1 Tax=uncultured Alistipes sp. TaxID=538949 RepID=UPI0032B20C61